MERLPVYSRWSRKSSLVRSLTVQSPEGGEGAACLRDDAPGEYRGPGQSPPGSGEDGDGTGGEDKEAGAETIGRSDSWAKHFIQGSHLIIFKTRGIFKMI